MAASRLFSGLSALTHWCVLFALLIVSMGIFWGSTSLVVQEQVSLTLNYHESVENEGTLPADTEVLVLVHDGSSAQSLSDVDIDGAKMDDRGALRNALIERAIVDPASTYDTLNGNGTTSTIRLPGENADEDVIAYVLALVPDDSNAGESGQSWSLYESQMVDGTGFDLVLSGSMDMIPVVGSEADTMRNAFDEARDHALFVSALQKPDEEKFPADTVVRICKKDDIESAVTLGGRDSFYQDEPDKTDTVDEDGKLSEPLARTWNSGVHYYVLARRPDGVFYETQLEGEGAYVAVEQSPLQLEKLDQEATEVAISAFGAGPEDNGWSWLTLMLGGMLGGLLLLIGIAVVWKKLTSSGRGQNQFVNGGRLPQPKREGDLKGRYDSDSNNIVESDKGNRGYYANWSKGHLRSELKSKDDEVRKLNQEIEKLQSQLNQQNRSTSDEEARVQEHTRQNKQDQKAGNSKPAPSTPKRSIDEKIGNAFKKWCQNSPPAILNKYPAFAKQLQSNIFGAKFKRIYRDRDSHETVFGTDVQDPVEYWLVQVKGRSFLLPQPSRNKFYELGDSFTGSTCSPNEVSTVQPAELKKRGDRYVLKKKGRIA